MARPLALDLFCGGGGAALGMIAAGLEVWGVDNNPRHARVYPGHFVCGDACAPPLRVEDFDFVWASPPCQRYSTGTPVWARDRHPDLVGRVRELLSDHAFTAIENVPGSPIRRDVVLTGPCVGLNRIKRRRHFELSFWCGLQPMPTGLGAAIWEAGEGVCITTSLCASNHYYARKRAGKPGRVPVSEARAVMGITTAMTARQVGESVPPAYAELIAREALKQMAMH